MLSFTNKNRKPINLEAALQYPLSPVPLSISNADGQRRKTNKAKLKEILYKCRRNEDVQEIQKDAYVLDMMALIRTMTQIPETFEGHLLLLNFSIFRTN